MWLFDQILPNKNPWGHLIDISTTESILGLKTNQQNTTPKLVTPKKLITVGASDRTDGRGSETAKMVPIHCISLTLRSICCSQYHQLYYTCCYMTFQSVFLLQDICNTQKYCIILSNFPELFKPPLLFLQCRTSCQSFPNPEDGCPQDTGKFLDFKNKKKILKSKKENPHTAQLHVQTTLFAQQGTEVRRQHTLTWAGKGTSAQEWSRSPGSAAPPRINLTKSTCHSTKH